MYKVGDVVVIRSWKSLVNEFETNHNPRCPNTTSLLGIDIYFSKGIANEICGKTIEITDSWEDVFQVDGWIVGVWAIDKLKTGSLHGR